MVDSEDFSQTNHADAVDHIKATPDSAQLGAAIALTLPIDLAQVIQQRCRQSGKSEAEIIVTLLRSAIGLNATADSTFQTAASRQELESLQVRLSRLEALLPRVERLEGKSIAF